MSIRLPILSSTLRSWPTCTPMPRNTPSKGAFNRDPLEIVTSHLHLDLQALENLLLLDKTRHRYVDRILAERQRTLLTARFQAHLIQCLIGDMALPADSCSARSRSCSSSASIPWSCCKARSSAN